MATLFGRKVHSRKEFPNYREPRSSGEASVDRKVYSRSDFPSYLTPLSSVTRAKPATTIEKGIRFENDCRTSLILRGYGVSNTKKTGDFGVDLIARQRGISIAVQCKDWSKKVGVRAIQEVVAGRIYYGCNKAVVVSQNGFTKAAEELARSNGVILCTKEELSRML